MKIFEKELKFCAKHKSEIYTVISLCLGASAIIEGFKAGSKAEKIIAEEEVKKGSKLTIKEKTKAAWKVAVPPAALAIGSAVFSIGSVRNSKKMIAKSEEITSALNAAYNFKEAQQNITMEKVKDISGEDGFKKIKHAVNEEMTKSNECDPIRNEEHGEGYHLYRDELTGQEFWATRGELDEAKNYVNSFFANGESEVDANIFYDSVPNMMACKFGTYVWTMPIDFSIDASEDASGRRVGTIVFTEVPTRSKDSEFDSGLYL